MVPRCNHLLSFQDKAHRHTVLWYKQLTLRLRFFFSFYVTASTYLSRIYTLSAHNNPVVFKHKKLFYHESGQTLEEKKISHQCLYPWRYTKPNWKKSLVTLLWAWGLEQPFSRNPFQPFSYFGFSRQLFCLVLILGQANWHCGQIMVLHMFSIFSTVTVVVRNNQ